METRRNPHDLAILAVEAMVRNASHGSPSLRPPLIQVARARPADHLTNGSTPAGNVALQLSWL